MKAIVNSKKRRKTARCWYLTHVILSTHKAKIRGLQFESIPGKIVLETLHRKKKSQKRLMK
jgi:hypothetical protein